MRAGPAEIISTSPPHSWKMCRAYRIVSLRPLVSSFFTAVLLSTVHQRHLLEEVTLVLDWLAPRAQRR
ncbi:hypothetical protein PFISCL1PPCAC_28515, partial [Pristionchus fissidentatus]